jgi:hypothetical protein
MRSAKSCFLLYESRNENGLRSACKRSAKKRSEKSNATTQRCGLLKGDRTRMAKVETALALGWCSAEMQCKQGRVVVAEGRWIIIRAKG